MKADFTGSSSHFCDAIQALSQAFRVRAPRFELGFKRWQRSVITTTLRSQNGSAISHGYETLSFQESGPVP